MLLQVIQLLHRHHLRRKVLVLDALVGQHRRRQRAGAHVERAEAFEVEFGQRVAALPQRLRLVVRERPHRIGQTRSPIREHRQIAPSKRIVDHVHLLSRRNDEPHIPPHLASSFSNTVVRYTPSSCTVSNVPS